jgi:hypothetical protein
VHAGVADGVTISCTFCGRNREPFCGGFVEVSPQVFAPVWRGPLFLAKHSILSYDAGSLIESGNNHSMNSRSSIVNSFSGTETNV